MSSTGYLKKSLTLALLGLTLSACAMTKENTSIFRQTADDEARVVVEAAAYRNGAQQRVTYNDPRIMEEYVLYRSDQGQAEILFTQTLPMHKRNTALDFDISPHVAVQSGPDPDVR